MACLLLVLTMFFNPPLALRLAAPLLTSLLLAATVAGCRTKPSVDTAAAGSGSSSGSGSSLPVSTPSLAPKTGALAAQQGPVQLTDAEVVARFEANAFR